MSETVAENKSNGSKAAVEIQPGLIEGVPIVTSVDEAPPGISYLARHWLIKNAVMEAVIPIDKTTNGAKIKWLARPFPQSLMDIALAFYKEVWDEHKSEAGTVGTYDPESGLWRLHCPSQEVSGGSCKMDLLTIEKKPGEVLAFSSHSHGSMGAFHSGTDTADEAEFDGLHITVGHINGEPEFSVEVTCRGYRKKIEKLSEVVGEQRPAVEVPEGWMEQVKATSFSYKPYVVGPQQHYHGNNWYNGMPGVYRGHDDPDKQCNCGAVDGVAHRASCPKALARTSTQSTMGGLATGGKLSKRERRRLRNYEKRVMGFLGFRAGETRVDGQGGLAGNRQLALEDKTPKLKDKNYFKDCPFVGCEDKAVKWDSKLAQWLCPEHFKYVRSQDNR